MKLHKFQVYDSITHHLHTASCIYHPKASLFAPPCIPPLSSSTALHPHHLSFPWAITLLSSLSICFFFFVIPSPFPPSLPTFSLTALSLFFVSMLLFLFCLLAYFVHSIPHMNEIMWCLSFSDWLISLSIIISRSIHSFTKGKIPLFFMTE